MSLCGKCLHAREAHTAENGHLMYCGSCRKVCDLDDFNTDYPKGGAICQDGVFLQLRIDK